jgi:hypothetical protein
MVSGNWKHLDEHLRLRLSDLEPELFEKFFLHFLCADVRLTIARNGQQITKRVISAETYATGRGRRQKGIDLRAVVEGGEEWVFQCKRHKTWGPAQTRKAIQEASKYQANHYFLVVACDPREGVQDEMKKHPNWTFWNLDRICAEFRLRVHPSKHAEVLFFLAPEELRRFVPFTTEALISPGKFFEPFLGADKLFRHDWKLVGREKELDALRSFVSGAQKVQVLAAKGGAGKSRLLQALCQKLADESPETQVLFLNPHLRGELSFAFLCTPQRRLIFVDDAHRTELVPLQLLTLAREDPSAKIVFATRPQGVEALFHKLYETGLADSMAPQLSLPALTRSDVKTLAAEALGPEAAADQVAELARLTADCPFLTVIAGELLRKGRLQWGKWSSDEEFRGHVFREFEKKNFEIIPEGDRDTVRWLIRLIAMLAPVAIGPQFAETAARALGCTAVWVESHLNWLRQSELLAGRDDGLRIVPDLFADFLVYDTCYEPKTRMPTFARTVSQEFSQSGPALLRNLSEATWIARLNGVSDDNLLKPLVDQEHARFEAASFHQRAQMLEHWSSFSFYLPAESLDLARRAIASKAAPTDTAPPLFAFRGRDSYDHVIDQVPALLKPVAKYYQQHRHAALDLLWELGSARKWVDIGGSNQNHPWSTIAEVIKFEPEKQVSVTLEALEWLNNRLQRQDGLKVLEAKVPVLRALVGPCFERIVEFTRREGRTVHFCHEAVLVKNTQPIRDLALAVLASVIERGSWLAALNALSALEMALPRSGGHNVQHVKDADKFREEWRPERLKALALYAKCASAHLGVAVQCRVRQTLKRHLAFEDDPAFAAECRRVLSEIRDDLVLQSAVVLVSHATIEFEWQAGGPRTANQREEVETLWNQKVRKVAVDLAATYPEAKALYEFLVRLMGELFRAGDPVGPVPLYSSLAQVAPDLALGLAEGIVFGQAETPLSHGWPALLDNNTQINDAKRLELFRRAMQSPVTSVSCAGIRALAWRSRQNQGLGEVERTLLLEKAENASPEEVMQLLDFVEWAGAGNVSLTSQILERLPIRTLAARLLWQILEAIVPHQEGQIQAPLATVQRVLEGLVCAPEINLDEHWREWGALVGQYPREIYQFFRARIAYAESGKATDQYYPIPAGFESQLRIPSLAKEQDFPAICDDLWLKAFDPEGKQGHAWVRLFQAVALAEPSVWLPRMQRCIANASSAETLGRLAQLLAFEGSLMIFRFPELAREFLARARTWGGEALKNMCWKLYAGAGPQARSYSGGTWDEGFDYVEAEAARAAKANAQDEILGPFYRWIVKTEQQDRLMNKLHAEAAMASLD